MIRHPWLCLAAVAALGLPALADPCGMVPPIFTGQGPPIVRVGLQKTYVSFKDGIESFVIRPGYRGQVAEFGMLIPFPSPPAIRKVADDVFAHVERAIDPPPVVAWDDRPMPVDEMSADAEGGGPPEPSPGQVIVLREEAVGMYEVAVLAAGSADALRRWMEQHGYQYPDGMDATCEDYVSEGWCFVAVKTRVGRKSAVQPRPGMREADASLPGGSSFDGNVQAMGFRFRTEELVVPMRLSAFNAGELRNVIYVLADEPLKVDRLPETFVKRQLPGAELRRNVQDLLPVVVQRWSDEAAKYVLQSLPGRWQEFERQRDPRPHNGLARDLLAADLLALKHDRLANPHEEREKELLNVGERLGLRDDMDALHREALAAEVERAAEEGLGMLDGMVLTVIDGDFPRDVLAEHNLTFSRYELPAGRNSPAHYDATAHGPNPGRGNVFAFRGRDRPVPVTPLPKGFQLGE